MKLHVDQCGREIKINDNPKRIVSLVPSQTELLFDLGLSEEVVGITKFCIHPHSWYRAKQRIGGTKSIDFDKVKALNPDLIIANKEENSKEEIEELSKHFPVWISDIISFDDALEMIQQIGIICNRKEKAEEINHRIKLQFSNLKVLKKKTTCFYLIWQKPYMLAGANTFINTLLSICGFENLAVNKEERYPEITAKEIFKTKAEYILLSSEPYPFKEKHLEEFNIKFPQSKTLLVNAELFSWYGSRLISAPKYLNKLIEAVNKLL